MAFEDAQGTVFTFAGAEFAVTNVKKKKTGASATDKYDVSTLALASGAKRVYQDPPLVDDPNKGSDAVVTISFLGKTEPPTDGKYTIECAKLGISGEATCSEFELEAALGEVIKGTASFAISVPENP